jgi:hypothetical protein
MVQEQIGGIGNGISESNDAVSGIEAKRKRIQFARATAADSAEAFGDNGRTSSPRKPRGIPKEKRAEVTISDTRAEVSSKVKGKPPTLPVEEGEKKVGRARKGTRTYPTLTEASDSAKLLLSFIEVANVTFVGASGEMTEWERGFMSAPLQRILARIPVEALQKGGLIVDCGALTVGASLYFARVLRGIKLPQFSKQKKGEEIVQDPQAPVSARPIETVGTVKAGDLDGLAQPIPSEIQYYMNGAI